MLCVEAVEDCTLSVGCANACSYGECGQESLCVNSVSLTGTGSDAGMILKVSVLLKALLKSDPMLYSTEIASLCFSLSAFLPPLWVQSFSSKFSGLLWLGLMFIILISCWGASITCRGVWILGSDIEWDVCPVLVAGTEVGEKKHETRNVGYPHRNMIWLTPLL